MDSLLNVVLFSGLAGFATIVGMLLVLYFERWTKKNSVSLISFAAGVLLGAAFFNLIPESLQLYNGSLIVVLLGIVAFYLLESAITIHSCQEGKCLRKQHRFGLMATLGLGFHSLLDGVAIGVGFEVSTAIGLITTLGVLLHELPEGITMMSIMIHSKVKKTKAIFNSTAVALATPVGAILSYFIFQSIDLSVLGMLLAFAAGSFIYVASSDLIPETHKKFKSRTIFLFLFGVALIYLVGSLV